MPIEDEMVGWHYDSMEVNLSKIWEVAWVGTWYDAVHGVTKSRKQLRDLSTADSSRTNGNYLLLF